MKISVLCCFLLFSLVFCVEDQYKTELEKFITTITDPWMTEWGSMESLLALFPEEEADVTLYKGVSFTGTRQDVLESIKHFFAEEVATKIRGMDELTGPVNISFGHQDFNCNKPPFKKPSDQVCYLKMRIALGTNVPLEDGSSTYCAIEKSTLWHVQVKEAQGESPFVKINYVVPDHAWKRLLLCYNSKKEGKDFKEDVYVDQLTHLLQGISRKDPMTEEGVEPTTADKQVSDQAITEPNEEL